MIKTFFIKLKERVLLKDKTIIPKDLFAGEGELINLLINNDGDNVLRKDIAPEESINSLIISNFNSDPELLKINHYGINLEVKF